MPNLTPEMASLKTLREWCRVTCAKYHNVEIKNMSTSFRDGLAFCAIIHKHRPDLIDFSLLSKDNVYQNNKLAFEVAEAKLGIPALLDPKEMASTKVPDCLSIITYLAEYYCYFNRKSHGSACSTSSHVTVLNSLSKSKPVGFKPLKNLTHLETGTDRLSGTRLRTACNLCFKPVHLIQRRVIDGKIYHRSCFRCKVCHSTLLPESYTQGSDSGSLICTFNTTEIKSICVDLDQQIETTENHSKCKFQPGYFSLGGLAITSVPCYTKKTESQDRPVCKTSDTGEEGTQERSREESKENKYSTVGLKSMIKETVPPHPVVPGVEDRPDEGAGGARPAPILADDSTQQHSEISSPCVLASEGSDQPVPADRQSLDSSVAPAPAPRTKTSLRKNSSPATGNSSNQSKSPSKPSHIPNKGTPKIRSNHPWMNIIHPGPWTQLPPAPAPVPTPRTKSVSNRQKRWCEPKTPTSNPFGEDVDEETQEEAVKHDSSDQTKSSVESSHLENEPILSSRPEAATITDPAEGVCGASNTVDTTSFPARNTSYIDSPVSDDKGSPGGSLPDVSEAVGPLVASDESQTYILLRSLSVPIITSDHTQSSSVPVDPTEADESFTSYQRKAACKENPFDREPAVPKSKTFQDLPSAQTPGPGHGFPLIKRKVQSDQYVSTENLQTEMRELNKHLEELEQKGVELEKKLRNCKNDKEEEQILMEWFCLVHERHVLVRKDTELVYLKKQQRLEERQADVDYQLRCLLNRPEKDWTQEDRCREQQLMKELVAIIDQRNQIISILDQDRQRERQEDELWEEKTKDKDFQKKELKELKKSKGKFKATQVFKMVNSKPTQGVKDSVDKKS